LKNVTLLKESAADGKLAYKLLGPDGRRVQAFDAFTKALEKAPFNTRVTYCKGVAAFINYYIEATGALREDGQPLSRLQHVEVLEGFREYLVLGAHSANELARRVNATMPSPMVKDASCSVMQAGVKRFLSLSERVRQEMEELYKHGLLHIPVDPSSLFEPGEKRPPTPYQLKALHANSVLAGVVAHGPQLLAEAAFKLGSGSAAYDEGRAFPFEYAVPFLQSLPTWRDKAQYSLSAASGGRIHEIQQLLWKDVHPDSGRVELVNPARRANDPSYMALSPEQRDKLAWKGRTTKATLLIEPFATMFFEALEQYRRVEYVPHGLHQFVFQYSQSSREGLPYFLSSPSSRSELFRAALKRAVPADLRVELSVHSLRHMYGTYLLNYFPREDGSFGLPMGLVMRLMGHAELKTTAKYARHDVELHRAELSYVNALVFGNGVQKSLLEMKRDALAAKLHIIETEMASEELCGEGIA
jgi:integrase